MERHLLRASVWLAFAMLVLVIAGGIEGTVRP